MDLALLLTVHIYHIDPNRIKLNEFSHFLYSETGSNKRKINGITDNSGPPAKLQKAIYPAYFIPELAHVIAMCDEKLPFVALAAELTKRKLPHSGLQVEAKSTSLVIKLLALPSPETLKSNAGEVSKIKNLPNIDKSTWNVLTKRLLSVAMRKQVKSNHSGHWMAELIFYETPLKSKHHREQGQRRPVYFQYDLGTSETVGKTIDSLLDDWARIVYLYALVHDFADQFKNGKCRRIFPPIVSEIHFSFSLVCRIVFANLHDQIVFVHESLDWLRSK